MSRAERRALVEREAPVLSVSRQCRLLAVSRASIYRRPVEVSAEDCTIMALIDRPYLARALLRLAAEDGVAGDPGPSRQPQTGPASDAARRPGGDLPATEYEQAGTGPQDLPLPAGWALDRAGQSGLVLGCHLHPDGQGLPLPGGDHGLGEPCRAGVATVEHARRGVLCRGTRGSALPIRQA